MSGLFPKANSQRSGIPLNARPIPKCQACRISKGRAHSQKVRPIPKGKAYSQKAGLFPKANSQRSGIPLNARPIPKGKFPKVWPTPKSKAYSQNSRIFLKGQNHAKMSGLFPKVGWAHS